MHIGIDISPLRGARTGVGNYCYCALKHMLEIADDCRFTGFASGLAPLNLGPLEGKLAYRYIPVPTRALYKVWSLVNAPKLDRCLGGIDVYHATNYFLPPTKKARRIVSIYDLSFLSVPELCSPKITRIFAETVPRFAREADAVLVCSEATKSEVVRLLDVAPEKIHVAYGAVNDELVPLEREAAADLVRKEMNIPTPYLLFVGTLEPRKNIPAIIRAFASLAKEIPHSLVLAGVSGWNSDEIFLEIERLNLGARVIKTGFVRTQAELAALYSAADAFLFPSRYEGFGLPVLEAMACGCPVVTADNTSLPEVAGDAALRVNAQNVESLAAAIRRVLEDALLRESMITKGREQAARFSWQVCAQTTLDLYKRLA